MPLDTASSGFSRRAARPLFSVLAVLALLAAVAACDGVGNDFEGTVETVTVSFADDAALIVDRTITVNAFVTDNFGTAVPGATVRWSVSEGTLASETSTAASDGEDRGTATVEWTLGTTADEQQITARVEGAEGVTSTTTLSVSAGPVGDIEAMLEQDTLQVDRTTVLRITRVEDTFGNVIPASDYASYGLNFFSLDTLVAEITDPPAGTEGAEDETRGVRGVGEGEALIGVIAAAPPPRGRGFKVADGAAADTLMLSVVSFLSAGPFPAAKISAGEGFSCGMDTEGAAYCWGANATGQLGVGDFTPRLVPERVVGLPGPVASISAGGSHACAVLDDGQVFCWGEAFLGRLGNGTSGNELFPDPVLARFPAGASEVVEVRAGESATCARTTSGEVYCWGFDGGGTVGNGAPPTPTEEDLLDISIATPVRVNAPSGVRFASLGSIALHTCAVAEDGAAYCWGLNSPEFRLGNGFNTNFNSPEPVRVQPFDIAFRSAAAHSLASSGLDVNGQLYGWGDLSVPEPSASGLIEQVFQATPVEPSEPFVTLAGGGGIHACALTSTGAASCWGDNLRGQLGTGDTTDTITPVPVETDLRFESIAVSFSHSCAVVEGGGEAYCWGDNQLGQAGTGGTQLAIFTPTRVETAPEDAPRPALRTSVAAHRRAWCAAIPDRLRRTTSVCGPLRLRGLR